MKTLLSTAVALSLSMSAAVHAGSLVDLSVVDRDTGATLSPHYHDGKYYVAGVPGHRYGVQMRNRTGQRVLTVLSVDGVNAISGTTASPDQNGYVLDAYQSTEIDGWRKSMNEIAEFNFTSLSDSYAAKTGRPNNVGVIGVAVFREKQPIVESRVDKIAERDSTAAPPPSAPAPSAAGALGAGAPERETAKPAPSSMAQKSMADNAVDRARQPVREESLGTGHGAREQSVITYTAFERANSRPDEVDSVWYDSYNNLVSRGVITAPRPIHRDPQPFPNEFVPDPAR
jgi:hypothetical protein